MLYHYDNHDNNNNNNANNFFLNCLRECATANDDSIYNDTIGY